MEDVVPPTPTPSDPTTTSDLAKELHLDSDSDLDTFPDDEEEESEEEDDSESDSDSDHGDLPRKPLPRAEDEEEEPDDNTPETNIRKFSRVLEGRRVKRREEEDDRSYVFHEDLFDFPKDRERWTEKDLQEHWEVAPLEMTKPGWDPVWADDDDWRVVRNEVEAGRDPPIAPYYVPYHKNYPAIPDNHYDISNPKSVVEELDRIEEFLNWVSYIFPDGSSYEGTVWDDLAHGKGVYVADQGLVRYEGEWLQNAMDGHGVVEVEIPENHPVPGSKLEEKMRAEGKIIKRDYMSTEDQKWLDMDIEDSLRVTAGHSETPFYESDAWVQVFGEKPEKGRYKYAGQWKHGRMHGCGVYEVNERIIYGRFYFGEHLDDSIGCDADVSALHAGIAEIAAAKARMFVNKPDGMVREERGPYGDPQHPYFYEEDDVWMAPGFVNQFYETPDYWKTYVEDVDQEREMWLNSFYKAPLRIPMPAELEYWWETDESPEFVLINKEPEPDPEDPSKLIYKEDPLIYHTRTGRIINYVEDEKYGVRLFWQPPLKEGEDVDPEKAEFLPLGFDEFYGQAKPEVKKEGWLVRLMTSVENTLNPLLGKLEKWTEEKKKAGEMNLKLIDQELELVEAEICLDEEMEDLESELKMKQKEEEKRTAVLEETEVSTPTGKDEVEFDEGEDEDEDYQAPSSFGAAFTSDKDRAPADDKKGKNSRSSPFSTLSLSFSMYQLPMLVPTKLKNSFSAWTTAKRSEFTELPSLRGNKFLTSQDAEFPSLASSVFYPQKPAGHLSLRAAFREPWRASKKRDHNMALSQLDGLAKSLLGPRASMASNYQNCLDSSIPCISKVPPISPTKLDITTCPLSLQYLDFPMDLSNFVTINNCEKY